MSAAPKLNSQVLIVDATTPQDVISYVLDQGHTQIVQESHPFHTCETDTALLLSTNPTIFFRHPVSSVFAPKSVGAEADAQYTVYHRRFMQAQEKHAIISEIQNSLSGKVKSTSLRADIVTVSDELVTNAIFNAPFVDSENSAPGASREDRSVAMHDGMQGEIFLACDTERLLVVCRDSYGTLNPNKLLSRVRNCYVQGVAANINMSNGGGAGIGSYMVFNSSISFFVAVHAGKKTVVGCVLPLSGSGRARAEMLKNLHYIFIK